MTMRRDIVIPIKPAQPASMQEVLERVHTLQESICQLRDENRKLDRIRDQYLIHLKQCMKDQEILKNILKTLRQQLDQPNFDPTEIEKQSAQRYTPPQPKSQTATASQSKRYAQSVPAAPQQMPAQIPPQMPPTPTQAKPETPTPQPAEQPPQDAPPPSITKHQSYLGENDLKFKYSLHTDKSSNVPTLGACFSPNGKYIGLTNGLSIIVVLAENGEAISSAILNTPVQTVVLHKKAIRFSPDSNTIAFSGHLNDAYLVQAQNCQVLNCFQGHSQEVSAIEFSPNGKWLITGGYDGTIIIWNTKTYEVIKKLTPQPSPIVSIVTNEDADLYAIGFLNGFVGMYNADFDPPMNSFQAHESPITEIDLSPLTQLLATSSEDSTVKIWNIMRGPASCKHTLSFHKTPITNITFSANDTIIISASRDSSVIIQNYKTETILYTIQNAHRGNILEIAHSPKQRMFLMSGDDQSLSVWEYASI
ncbi:hypothetical protein TVAG_076390 [Trichomonas vaginalis G3]|uniref:Uncharacterized protein n=1 Tax=Trichomonas vaginalis (strain ATCC PRA-98 / G3) TaxID=412133 RepID=A2D9N6_TRIV3|nr:WD repeat-containing protein family [Trichomonas vaginalis G3]EAY22892.1 hypothetical protein TVAG_076390 [Trichomonas vaginalis G3]KAI5527392.1 WD repeat-containing protein family [Trichomonas vaginalis G3]|eukprot:XP_001583878.1 hypothetical protein [Trichomonas vaginalis G3]